MAMMRILSVVGARPQFVKLAPVARAFSIYQECKHSVVHTGQHYDNDMSDDFFNLLEIPKPEHNLAIGSGSHGAQTAAMLVAIENYLIAEEPDGVLVYGDTNSTLAAVLAAVKIGVPVAHIEAGLRSFNRGMPEEINRVTADHCSDRLYAPTPLAMRNLEHENLKKRSYLGGDVMRDAVEQFHKVALRKSDLLERLGLNDTDFALLTLHRPVNTKKEVLTNLLTVLDDFSADNLPILFPVHPRTRAVIDSIGFSPKALVLHSPLNYLDMLACVGSARFVATDSGGLQKEAAFLHTPCITIRTETEWNELIELGVNRLVSTQSKDIEQALSETIGSSQIFSNSVRLSLDQHFGAGDAAQRTIGDYLSWLAESRD